MTDIVTRLRCYPEDEIREAAAEIIRLRAAIITQGAEIDRICEFSLADRAEIIRLRALNSKLVKHDGDAEAVCDGYAIENQQFHDEIERLRTLLVDAGIVFR